MTEITTPSAAFVALGEGFWLKSGFDWYRERNGGLVWTDVAEEFLLDEQQWRFTPDLGAGPWVKYQVKVERVD